MFSLELCTLDKCIYILSSRIFYLLLRFGSLYIITYNCISYKFNIWGWYVLASREFIYRIKGVKWLSISYKLKNLS